MRDENKAVTSITTLLQQGQIAAAEQQSLKMLSAAVDVAEAYYCHGLVEKAKGNIAAAIENFKQATCCDRQLAIAWLQWALLELQQNQNYSLAAQLFATVLALQPASLSIYYPYTFALNESRQFQQTKQLLATKVVDFPAELQFKLRQNLGQAYFFLGEYQHAKKCAQQNLSLQAQDVAALTLLAFCSYELADYQQAEALYQQILQQQPNNHAILHALANLMMLLGHYQQALALFECRIPLLEARAGAYSKFPTEKRWTGEQSLWEKIVCLRCEQGNGDFIRFIRFLPQLLHKVGAQGRVIVEVHRAMHCLCADLPDNVQIVDNSMTIECDYYVYLMSLPYLLQAQLTQLPASYAIPLQERALCIKKSKPFAIGLNWAGNSDHDRDHLRSFTVTEYLPLLAEPECEFHSLQFSGHAHDCQQLTTAYGIVDHCSQLHDFQDTANLIQQLDLVITSDTAVAHLSASLHKPTWVLLSYVPETLWLLDRDDSPWYSSVRLFRQQQANHWQSLMPELLQALQRFKKQHSENSFFLHK